jgi:nucleoside-diphosphate-sugar epimerase
VSTGARPRLAITGAAGLIGQVLVGALGERYAIQAIDRRRRRATWRRADLSKPRAAAAALRGADLVVDLAANPSPTLSWEGARRNNIPTTFNVLEAARIAGVRRVVYASSNHVTGKYEEDEPYASIAAGRYDGLDPAQIRRITPLDPVRPDGPYGLSKAFGEAAGRYFADEHGLSVLCLRIGTVNRTDRPTTPRQFATLLTHRDLVELVRCCLEAPEELRFGVYYGVSANTWRFWDIGSAEAELGYESRDNAERWR